MAAEVATAEAVDMAEEATADTVDSRSPKQGVELIAMFLLVQNIIW